MKSAFWLFVGLFLGLGVSYVALSRAENAALPAGVDAADEAAMRGAAERIVGNRLGERRPAEAGEPEEELKSRIGRYLMDLFDQVDGGTDEERRIIRRTLRENDEILHETLGENLKAKIQRANNPRPAVVPHPPVAPRRHAPLRLDLEETRDVKPPAPAATLPPELDPDAAI